MTFTCGPYFFGYYGEARVSYGELEIENPTPEEIEHYVTGGWNAVSRKD